MKASRTFLAVVAAVLAAYAAAFLWNPAFLGELVQLDFKGSNASVEIRAFYGGLELGLGLFFAFAAYDVRMIRTALVAFALIFGCAGLARLWGIAQFDFADPSQPVVTGLEVGAAIAATWLVRRVRVDFP